MTFEKFYFVELGYIGLLTAAVIASRGIEVIGVDVSKRVIDIINQGKEHIVEPDLNMLVQATVNLKNYVQRFLQSLHKHLLLR
jgi:UDP-N-acetyl-D-mannosaminuronic acid dehydrogenase